MQAEGEPKAQPVAQSGQLHVHWCSADKPRPNPWQVKDGKNGHVARVASPAEGAAVWQAYESAGEKLKGVSPKAMRQTVKRLAGQIVSGQLPLALGDGLDGEG